MQNNVESFKIKPQNTIKHALSAFLLKFSIIKLLLIATIVYMVENDKDNIDYKKPDGEPVFFADPPGSRSLKETTKDSVRLYFQPIQKGYLFLTEKIKSLLDK